MCNVGDIILVDDYVHNGVQIGKHSFVVLSIESGQIEGMEYNLMCNVMSSFKNQQQKQHKLSYPGNFPVEIGDRFVANDNNREGYIKADQLYFLDTNNLNFKVIGSLESDFFNLLLDFIENLTTEIEYITDNLSKQVKL